MHNEVCGCCEDNINPDRLLRLALDVGEGMLKNGAEIHRVEESIHKICSAYGAAHIEVFAITSLIVASIRLSNGKYSLQMRRVYNSSNNLLRVEELNNISRRVCVEVPSLDEFEIMIFEAKQKTQPSRVLNYLGGILAAGSFAILFGGNLFDALVAAIMGIVVVFIGNLTTKKAIPIVKNLFISFVCGILINIFIRLGIGTDENMIMIGTIMLLIPGLAIGNSLSDMVCGDVLSGTTRLIQAFMTAIMIAVGFGIAIFVSGVML